MRTGEAPSHRPATGRWLSLAAWLLIVFAAAALGAIGSRDAPQIYAQLALPRWAPPSGVFGPVWTALYALMGVAAWLVWRAPGRHPWAIGLFAAQLAVNVLWSWLFFAWLSGPMAALDVVLLLMLVAATAIAFWRVRRLAGVLLLPYLAWVAFAAVLTFSAWLRNPAIL
jgi:translocator protein